MRFAPGPLGRPLTPHEETCSCPGAQEARHKAGKRKDTDDMPLLWCDCEECEIIMLQWIAKDPNWKDGEYDPR